MQRIVKYGVMFLIIAAWIVSGGLIIQQAEAAFTKLPTPADLPTGNGHSSSFSPDQTYLAIAHQVSPYVTIYKHKGDIFEKLDDPDVLPTGIGHNVSFSMEGTYLAVTHAFSPYVTIYKRSVDTFTKLNDPDILPKGALTAGAGLSFSADGTYLALGSDGPYLTIYKRNGDTFTKLVSPNGPDVLPAGDAYGVTFSADGVYLAIAHNNSPCVTIYKRSGDTFTKLDDPDVLPTGNGFGASFSPDGTYLVIGHYVTPYVTIYYRSGDTFTKLTNPNILPADCGCGPSFTADGIYLAVAHDVSPFVTIYKVGPIHPTFANNGSGATTLTINKPVGLEENDVMIANISVRGGTGTAITPPSGWNLVRRSNSKTTLAHATYWKAATGSESGSYTWTFSSSQKASGGIQGYRGIDTTNPIHVENGQVNGSSKTITAPSITTTVDNTMLVFGGGMATGTTVSSYPDGLAMRFEAASTGGGATTRTTTTSGDEPKETAGSTGTRTITITGKKGAVSIGHLLALKPANAK